MVVDHNEYVGAYGFTFQVQSSQLDISNSQRTIYKSEVTSAREWHLMSDIFRNTFVKQIPSFEARMPNLNNHLESR